ncbi:MAG TPA: hypothetical protein VFS97_14040 [Nitrososphaeraceae archaeon]|nr:hypothetical protein [Nitrososphaeraceae archaeon]
MSQIQQQEEDNTIDTKIKDKLGAEMYEVVKVLAIILGFKTFEDYVAHCFKC